MGLPPKLKSSPRFAHQTGESPGLFDQLAFEFGSEVTSFEHGSVRLSFRQTPLGVRLHKIHISVIDSRRVPRTLNPRKRFNISSPLVRGKSIVATTMKYKPAIGLIR